MKAFVTGGTGFIGRNVIRELLARGHEVVALVRSGKDAQDMETMGVTPVFGDILQPETMREAMQGSGAVFHVAGSYDIGAKDMKKVRQINVEGTRKVMELAQELEIPKIIYTSTITVFGDTHGQVVDERYPIPTGDLLTEYDRTKYEAHKHVVLPMIERGAPIIIVMPGVVYGPGDHSLIGDMMRRFYLGQLFALPGPELTITWAHVDDIGEGFVLAAEQGEPGETYILAGPIYSLGEMVHIWSELTGRPAPVISIPASVIKPLAPVVGLISQVLPLPSLINQEAAAITGASYIARSDKAKEKLGWQPRPVLEGMRDTFNWMAHDIPQPKFASKNKRRRIAAVAVGAALGIFLVWWLREREE